MVPDTQETDTILHHFRMAFRSRVISPMLQVKKLGLRMVKSLA